ncbi:MAG: ScpA family protein [bacterium]|nr:ScpA family protein [bacterium]MDE0287392.1 ScpA family protein [bacterium]MDE0439646.1 ScpA family protein [bacterium]
MTYEVRTDVYNGPFDLLLQLVGRNHVDITKVRITGIVDDFLQTLHERDPGLDTTSGFVLMAAILIHLKARFLLPDEEEIDLEEELALLDERDRLVARLLTLLTFQDVATVLRYRFTEAGRHVGRSVGIDRPLARPRSPLLPEGVTPATLAALIDGMAGTDLAEPEVEMDYLDLDLPSVGDAIEEIRTRIVAELESTFERLVAHCTRRVEVAAYFLAILELARWGVVSVAQNDPYEISVRRTRGAPAELPVAYGNGA